MEASIHDKILVLEPSRTKLNAHACLRFLLRIKKKFSAKVTLGKIFK
jgi:hypothetical protein